MNYIKRGLKSANTEVFEMKISVALLALLSLSCVSASIHPFFLKYREGSRYFLYQHDDGRFEIVDTLQTDPESRFNAESDVRILLFTRSNPTNAYVLTGLNDGSLSSSPFSHGKDTKVISHGWNNNGGSEVNTDIRNAFLGAMDVNVIVVDWGAGANGAYSTAVANVPIVAQWMGRVINWIIARGSGIGRFHIMGHSLGGHIAGQTARNVNGNIPYVTAFDPAGPSWGPGTDRIRSSDASYVEVIHTDAGSLGLREPVGDNDFYPNEGSGMPGCSIINVGCSHGRSYEYFADSIDHTRFMSQQCSNVEEALNNRCSNLSQLHMGGSRVKASRGVFHLRTNANKPFHMG